MHAKASASRIIRSLVVLVILISINLLAHRFFSRIDLTENRDYTLSRSTENVLHRLDDLVNIKVYFSKELPSYFATLDRQVKDLLDEYRAKGGGDIQVEFIDPADDPILEQTVQSMGIPKRPVTIYEREKAEAMNVYLGMAIQYEEKTEVIPWIEDPTRLEYDLTSAIIKVSVERKAVGISSTGATLPEKFQGLQSILSQQYQVRIVDLNAGPVPPEVTTLVVEDSDSLEELGLYHLDQFIMRGGRTLILAAPTTVDLSTLNAQNRPSKLAPLLKNYGVEIQSSLVVDAQSARVAFDVGSFLPLSLRYPWFPQVIEAGFSSENPVTSRLQSLVLPWTSALALTPVDSTGGGQVTAEVLAKSSPQSFSAKPPYNLNPQAPLTLPAAGVEPQNLIVALTGSFPSHWRGGRALPVDTLGIVTPQPGPELSPETQIVVAGGTSFLENRFLQQFPANAVFFANAVDWMSLGDDLIAIRSRSAASRPLREVDDGKKGMFKALAVFPVPVLVVLFGLFRARWRRGRRKRLALEFERKVA